MSLTLISMEKIWVTLRDHHLQFVAKFTYLLTPPYLQFSLYHPLLKLHPSETDTEINI